MDLETAIWIVVGLVLAVVTWKAIQRNERDGVRDDDFGNASAWDSRDSDSGSND